MFNNDSKLLINFDWVLADTYCSYTGDTRDAINARRRRGEWLEGNHYIVRKRRIWINLVAVKQWLTKSQANPYYKNHPNKEHGTQKR